MHGPTDTHDWLVLWLIGGKQYAIIPTQRPMDDCGIVRTQSNLWLLSSFSGDLDTAEPLTGKKNKEAEESNNFFSSLGHAHFLFK